MLNSKNGENMARYRKPNKRNPIEQALEEFSARRLAYNTEQNEGTARFIKFLESEYGFTNVQPVAGIAYNQFFVANKGRARTKMFIKRGSHHGLYENEYVMGRHIYEIDNVHFLEPLCYNDFSEFNFFANAYVQGVTLKTAMMRGELDAATRARIIEDLFAIFCALRNSDIVHRDIRPDNLMLTDGRLVLIDFQLAVSKRNYTELEYLTQRPARLRSLGEDVFRYRKYTWDDAHSLLRVLEYIGRDASYGERYDEIHREIKAHIGIDTIHSTVRENPFGRLARHMVPKKLRKKYIAKRG